jgi:hypothetical protein
MAKPDLKRDQLFTEDLLHDLKTHKIHLICPAKFKDSLCTDYLANHLSLSTYDVARLCNTVNTKREVGCLYPAHTVTLFPVAADLKLPKCFDDVWEAHEQYFKTAKWLLVFDKNDLLDNAKVREAFENGLARKQAQLPEVDWYFE